MFYKFSIKQIRAFFLFLAIFIGLIHTWLLRYFIESDSIPFLDIGDAVFRGDFGALVNGVWNPIYAIIQGFFLFLLKPGLYSEIIVVHIVNFFTYAFALFCFEFFFRRFIEDKQEEEVWMWMCLGYSLFIWSSTNLITISGVTPDMLLSGFVYLASGLLLKIKVGLKNWVNFVLLGLVLGLGYLTKEAMFPIAFVFIILSFFAVPDKKYKFLKSVVALACFLLIAGPFVFSLSKSRGYFTYGETGKLNYHWYADRNVCECFENGFPGCSNLTHPLRVLFNDPTVFEYSTPFNVTYPLVYDTSYWCQGSKPYFDLIGQIKAILINLREYFYLFFLMQIVLLTSYLALLVLSGRKLKVIKDLLENWVMLTVPIFVMLMYSLVHVEFRYLGAYVVIFLLGLFSALKLPLVEEVQSVKKSLVLVSMFSMVLGGILSKDLLENRPLAQELKVNLRVAKGLQKAGIKEGEKVGVIGIYDDYYWARLAKLHIIAEIPSDEDISNFWIADNTLKTSVLNVFKNAGAKILIAGRAPGYSSRFGWKHIEDTPYFFYKL